MATKKNADGTTKRARFTRHGDRFKSWRQASASAAANASEVPQAELTRVSLDKVIVEVDKILVDQSSFQASKQMSSQRLKTLVSQGDKLTTVLKTIVKQHYGSGSDKLVEFGIQPFRTRPKATVEPTPAPTPDPGTPVSTPGAPVPAHTPLDTK
jgi:hypothetical protein